MEPYSPTHLAALAVLVAGLPLAVVLGRRERNRGDDRLSRGFAVAIPLVFVPTQVVELATRWDVEVSVPLHLCDLAWLAAAAALADLVDRFGRDRVSIELTCHGHPLDDERNAALAGLAPRFGLNVVATTGAHFAEPSRGRLAMAMGAIRGVSRGTASSAPIGR